MPRTSARVRGSICSGIVAPSGPYGATGLPISGRVLRAEPMLIHAATTGLELGDAGGQFGVGVVDEHNGSSGADQREKSVFESSLARRHNATTPLPPTLRGLPDGMSARGQHTSASLDLPYR